MGDGCLPNNSYPSYDTDFISSRGLQSNLDDGHVCAPFSILIFLLPWQNGCRFIGGI